MGLSIQCAQGHSLFSLTPATTGSSPVSEATWLRLLAALGCRLGHKVILLVATAIYDHHLRLRPRLPLLGLLRLLALLLLLLGLLLLGLLLLLLPHLLFLLLLPRCCRWLAQQRRQQLLPIQLRLLRAHQVRQLLTRGGALRRQLPDLVVCRG